MSDLVAYELTDAHELDTYGGTTHLRDGLHINIGDALREGVTEQNPRGVIVTDDPLLISRLDGRTLDEPQPYGYDLRRTTVPDGAKVTSHQLLVHRRLDGGEDHDRQHARDRSDVPSIGLVDALLPGVDPVSVAHANANRAPQATPHATAIAQASQVAEAAQQAVARAQASTADQQPAPTTTEQPEQPGADSTGAGEQPGHPDAAAQAAAEAAAAKTQQPDAQTSGRSTDVRSR